MAETCIFVVDDERKILDELSYALGRRFEAKVETADSVAKAKALLDDKIREAGREAITGIVSDLNFPGDDENGLHLAYYASKADIPLIFYTKTQPALMAQVARLYSTVSVPKSDGVEALVRTIEERWQLRSKQ